MSKGAEGMEQPPENVVSIKEDKFLPRAEYRVIYMPHGPEVRITQDELGEKNKMRILCVELMYSEYPRMHADASQARDALKFLEPLPGEEGNVSFEHALEVARRAKSRCFYTDMYLPPELVAQEFDERSGRLAADQRTVMAAAMAGVVAAMYNGKLQEWLNALFKGPVVDRRMVLGGIGVAAGTLALSALPRPVQDFLYPEAGSDARWSESSLSRTGFRVARRAEELLSSRPTFLGTMIMRNFCFALKARAAARKVIEDDPDTSNTGKVRAVMPVGDGHFGVEEAFKLSDEQLLDAMEALADRLQLPDESRESMYSLAELRMRARRDATAVIHPLRKQ
jgi:hypothetical protein